MYSYVYVWKTLSMSFKVYQISLFNVPWNFFVFALLPGKIWKVKNYSKIKFGKPEISGKASFLKTMETDFKGKHPKYWIKVNDLCSIRKPEEFAFEKRF